jgi:hypothetical protein
MVLRLGMGAPESGCDQDEKKRYALEMGCIHVRLRWLVDVVPCGRPFARSICPAPRDGARPPVFTKESYPGQFRSGMRHRT